MEKVLLKASGVCKNFGKRDKTASVLDNIDLEIYEGDFTVIMGPSGAGKSTLLYALSGMDSITSGSVEYRGGGQALRLEKLSEAQMTRLRAEEFGFVFQQTHLVANLTLEENILVAGYNTGTHMQADVVLHAEKLERDFGIEAVKNHLPAEASGGEAQRAAIARAIINTPKLLFADEPTGALNRANTEAVLDILSDLHKAGQSIVMVTHDLRAACRATRLLYLSDGQIAGDKRLPPYEPAAASAREAELTVWLQGLTW